MEQASFQSDPFKIFNVNLFLSPEFKTLQTTSYIDVDGTRSEKKTKTEKKKKAKCVSNCYLRVTYTVVI